MTETEATSIPALIQLYQEAVKRAGDAEEEAMRLRHVLDKTTNLYKFTLEDKGEQSLCVIDPEGKVIPIMEGATEEERIRVLVRIAFRETASKGQLADGDNPMFSKEGLAEFEDHKRTAVEFYEAELERMRNSREYAAFRAAEDHQTGCHRLLEQREDDVIAAIKAGAFRDATDALVALDFLLETYLLEDEGEKSALYISVRRYLAGSTQTSREAAE